MERKVKLIIVIHLIFLICVISPAIADVQNEKISPVTSNSIFELRDYYNPLTDADVRSLRDLVNEEFKKSSSLVANKSLIGVGGGDLYYPKGAKIVAFYYSIDSNGVPHEFIGLAQNPESVNATIFKVMEWYKNETANQSTMAETSDWEYVWSAGTFYEYYPYGGVGNNIEILRKHIDSSRDYFSVHQVFQQSPGWTLHGNSYISTWGEAWHDWSMCAGNPVLWSWGPTGTVNPNPSVTVGLYPPSLSWTFPFPGSSFIDDGATNPAQKTAKWRITMLNQDTFGTKLFEPGSSIAITPWQGRSTIGYYWAKGHFQNLAPLFDWQECWYYWYCWWEYY